MVTNIYGWGVIFTYAKHKQFTLATFTCQYGRKIANVALSLIVQKWPILIADNHFCFGENVLELVETQMLLSFTDQALVVHRYSMVSNRGTFIVY